MTYTGQQYDSVTQQYYLRARFYNPTIGRFTQEDVYRGDGLNLYDYCDSNPVIYFDPSGFATDREKNMGGTPKMTKSKTGKQVLQNTYDMGNLDISGISDPKIKAARNQQNDFLNTKIDAKTKSEIKFYSEKLDKQMYGTTNKDKVLHREAWQSLDEGNMAHIVAAVDAWNDGTSRYNSGRPLKETGPRSPEVRKFMTDAPNYEIEDAGINKSEGAKMKKQYDKSTKNNEQINNNKCP